MTIDYYSNFFEIDFLPETTSDVVVTKMKHHFARHGIPKVVISDGGPQYTSEKFKKFSQSWGFSHETSSPGNSKANGAAEAAVKVAKRMMKKCLAAKEDPYLGLLNVRNTPTEGVLTSPAQRLFGRRTRTQVPCTLKTIQHDSGPDDKQQLEDKRMLVVERHNRKYSGRPLKPLRVGDTVRMQPIQTGRKEWNEATVTAEIKPRTYSVRSDNGHCFKRNRQQLRLARKSRVEDDDVNLEVPTFPNCQSPRRSRDDELIQDKQCVQSSANLSNTQTDSVIPTRDVPKNTSSPKSDMFKTKSGRVVKPVKRLDL